MYKIIIKADTNDADYITFIKDIDEETLELIKPVVEAIKNFKSYKTEARNGTVWNNINNYPKEECLRDDLGEKSAKELYGHLEEFEEFDDLTPYGEYGIHTIESVLVMKVESVTTLL